MIICTVSIWLELPHDASFELKLIIFVELLKDFLLVGRRQSLDSNIEKWKQIGLSKDVDI